MTACLPPPTLPLPTSLPFTAPPNSSAEPPAGHASLLATLRDLSSELLLETARNEALEREMALRAAGDGAVAGRDRGDGAVRKPAALPPPPAPATPIPALQALQHPATATLTAHGGGGSGGGGDGGSATPTHLPPGAYEAAVALVREEGRSRALAAALDEERRRRCAVEEVAGALQRQAEDRKSVV